MPFAAGARPGAAPGRGGTRGVRSSRTGQGFLEKPSQCAREVRPFQLAVPATLAFAVGIALDDHAQLSALRELRINFPNEFVFPLFFEPGGLLPWAASDDGDVFCWSTDGASGTWEGVTVPRSDSPERFKLSMAQFLVQGLTGRIKSSALPPYFVSGTGSFEPHPG